MTNPLRWLWKRLQRWIDSRSRMRVFGKIPNDERLWSQKHVDLSGSRYR